MEILELKNTITAIKENSLKSLHNRMEMTEERISKLEDRPTKIIWCEQQGAKRLEKIHRASRICGINLTLCH